jgi:hypothetical protein
MIRTLRHQAKLVKVHLTTDGSLAEIRDQETWRMDLRALTNEERRMMRNDVLAYFLGYYDETVGSWVLAHRMTAHYNW